MKKGVQIVSIIFMICFLVCPTVVHAKDLDYMEEKNKVYDSLHDSIQENWKSGFEELETTDEIEIKGPFGERVLRSLANIFYKHLVSIKGWSLFIGLISVVLGVFIAVTAKLNKKLRKFAITFLVVTVPILLIIFVFGISKLISMFL